MVPLLTRDVRQLRADVQLHYDALVSAYTLLWGEHLHHGYWDHPTSLASKEHAQIRLIEQLVAFSGLLPGSAVADIGCGIGGSARWLTSRYGCRMVGLSLSGAQLREALRRRPQPVGWVQGDAAALPLATGVFDAVWVVECSEHVADRLTFLGECRRVVRDGGRLALATWLRAPGVPAEQLADIHADFHLAPLSDADEILRYLDASGWKDADWRDVTPHVTRTWDLCIEATSQPLVRAALPLLPEPVRHFVFAFPRLREAYSSGEMQYGLFRACAA